MSDNKMFLENDNNVIDGKESPSEFLSRQPLDIQSNILKNMENVFNGQIVDPNNSFTYLTNVFSIEASKFAQDEHNMFDNIYSINSVSDEQLHKHISDFEYVGLYSTPSATDMTIVISTNFILNHGVDLNNGYKKILLPKDTTFKIGNITFGIYYPIEILVNTYNKSVIVKYDISDIDELAQVDNSTIETTNFTKSNIPYFMFTIPIYQFEVDVYKEVINSDIGHKRRYSYTNDFYAVKVYNKIDNRWRLLKTTMSDYIYDSFNPSVKVKVYDDINELVVEVPYIYLKNKLISGEIKVVIYTTVGGLDISIDALPDRTITYKLGKEGDDRYVVDDTINDYIVFTTSSRSIAGGTTKKSFKDKKDSVVYNMLDRVPVTDDELDRYFNKNGFGHYKYKDDINDRVHIASKYLKFDNDDPVYAYNGYVSISHNDLIYNDNIKSDGEGIYTITPKAIYVNNGNTVEIANNATYAKLHSMSPDDLVRHMNENNSKYLMYPYHICIDHTTDYPVATSYDLYDNTITNRRYHEEHPKIKYDVRLVSSTISIDEYGENGYKIRLGVVKPDNIPNNKFTMILSCTSVTKDKFGYIGHHAGYDEKNKVHLYDFILLTDFTLKEDTIDVKDYYQYTTSTPLSNKVKLDSTWTVSMFISDAIANTDVRVEAIQSEIPYMFRNNDLVGIKSFKFDTRLGKWLKGKVSNNLSVLWSPSKKEIHELDVPATYTELIYETDEHGNHITEIVDNVRQLKIKHNIGDPILDNDGNPILKYKKGDIKLDAFKNDVIVSVSKSSLLIETFLFDYNYIIVSKKIRISKLYEIKNDIRNYITTLNRLTSDLTDRTTICFKPVSTVGLVPSIKGNNDSLIPLKLRFKFKYIVKQSIIDSKERQQSLIDRTGDIIQDILYTSDVISMSNITKVLHDTFTDEIISIEYDGFNDTNIKTIINEDKSTKFVLAKELVYNSVSDTYMLVDDIDISFTTT